MRKKYFKKLVGLAAWVVLMFSGITVNAQEPGSIYIVKPGDSLSKIAKETYGSADMWQVIYESNKDQIKNPTEISVSQQLFLPDITGQASGVPETVGVLSVTESPAAEAAVEPVYITESGLVPINNLANIASIKKKCTDEEFQAAYNTATQIVTPLVGLSREEQLLGIAVMLRQMADSGQVTYSTSDAHYNDPYGYLVLGTASCAGCTRTTGLCLNMLGIPYEHVNENQWGHQWCRVNIDGTYWICDAYGLYVGPEPAPYAHPFMYLF